MTQVEAGQRDTTKYNNVWWKVGDILGNVDNDHEVHVVIT